MEIVKRAREIAEEAHRGATYGGATFLEGHLDVVAGLLGPYGEFAQALGYLHDALEDTDLRAGVVQELLGPVGLRALLFVTDPPGPTRKVRKAIAYERLRTMPRGVPESIALVVKAADRLANIRASVVTADARHLKMYRGEHEAFVAAVRCPETERFVREATDLLFP